MSNVYVNVETGKKIKVYSETWVHVWDSDDDINFWDTAEGIASWCMESIDDDHEKYKEIQEAYANEDWLEVIELEGCRYCDYELEERWVVEELTQGETK